MSAISTQSDRDSGSSVYVDPLTTMVKTQIIKSIKSMFGDTFSLDSSILDSITSLVVQIIKKVQAEIVAGTLSFSLSDYETQESATAASTAVVGSSSNQDDIANKMSGSSAAGELAAFSSQLGAKAEDDSLANATSADLRADKNGLLKESIARIKYNLVSSFTKLGFSVHDGKGNLIVFLPVPYEERNKLPGKKYQILAKTAADVNVTVGDDFALRRIDVINDLKNITGNEPWLWPLADAIMYRDKIPSAGINAIIDNINHETKLSVLGKIFSAEGDVEPASGQTFTEAIEAIDDSQNMFKDLVGIDLNASNIEGSVKSILSMYKKALFIQEYEHLFHDIVNRAINDASMSGFDSAAVTAFKSDIGIVIADSDDFTTTMNKFEAAGHLDWVYQEAAGMVTASLPMNKKSAWSSNVIRFGTPGFTIDADTTVTPKSSLAFLSLLSIDKRINEITLKKVKLGEVFGWNSDISDNSELSDIDVWMPVWNNGGEEGPTTQSKSLTSEEPDDSEGGFTEFFTFITGITDKAAANAIANSTTYEAELRLLFKEESSFATLKENISTATTKLEEKLFNDNGGANGFADVGAMFGDANEKNASLRFTVMKGENEPNTDVRSFRLIPIGESQKTYEWFWLYDEAIEVNVTAGSVSVNNIMLYNINKDASKLPAGTNLYNWDEEAVTGITDTVKYNGMFRFEFIDDADNKTPIGEFPVFPGENNLNNIFFGGADTFFGGDNGGFAPGPEIRYLAKGDTIFFPGIERKEKTANQDGTYPVKDVVGEEFAKFNSSGAIEALAGGDLRGSLSGATITVKKLADNWDGHQEYWDSADKTSFEESAETVTTSFAVDSRNKEGALLLFKIENTTDDFLVKQRIIMNITFVDEMGGSVNGVEVELMQHPDEMHNDWVGPNIDDLWGDETNKSTTVHFNVEGIDMSEVKGVKFVPILKKADAQNVNFFDSGDQANIYINKTLGKSATNITGTSEFELALTLYKDKNATIENNVYKYTEMYAVYVTVLKTGHTEEEQFEAMRIGIFPEADNWIGSIFIGGGFDPADGGFFDDFQQNVTIEGSFDGVALAEKVLIFADPFAAFKVTFNADGETGTFQDNMMDHPQNINWIIEDGAVKITNQNDQSMSNYLWIENINNGTLTSVEDVTAPNMPDMIIIGMGSSTNYSPKHEVIYFGIDIDRGLPETDQTFLQSNPAP